MKQTDAVRAACCPATPKAPMAGGSRLESRTGRFDLFREGARGAAMSRADTLFNDAVDRSDRAASAFACGLDRSAGGEALQAGASDARSSRGEPQTAATRRAAETAAAPRGARWRAVPLWSWPRSSPPAPWLVEPSGSGPRLLDRRRDGGRAVIRGRRGGRPGHAGGETRAAAGRTSGVVVFSVEPAVLAPRADTETPVIFPGYMLPDDSLEDTAHEGS